VLQYVREVPRVATVIGRLGGRAAVGGSAGLWVGGGAGARRPGRLVPRSESVEDGADGLADAAADLEVHARVEGEATGVVVDLDDDRLLGEDRVAAGGPGRQGGPEREDEVGS